MTAIEIRDIANSEIIRSAMIEHKKLLIIFAAVPKTLREKIQLLHRSERPQQICCECYNQFYTLSDMTTCEGTLCQPCVEFHNLD